MTTVASLSVDISADTRSFDTGMSNVSTKVDGFKTSIADSMRSAGASLTSVGTSITALSLPFAGLATAALSSFSDSQKSIAQLDATLKSTGGKAGVTKDAALKLASSLQSVTMFSDEAVLSGENLLLTFTNIGADVFDQATTAALDMSTAMGTDVKSSAIQLGKALNNPIEGLTSLTRVGVTFTDAQKAQIQALQDAGDMAGAQSIILKELQTEFGGSAVAAGSTFAGGLEILKNRADDVLETIGEELVPTVGILTDFIGDGITAFENLDPPMKTVIAHVVAVGAGLAIVGPVIAAIGLGLSALAPVVGAVGLAFGLMLSPIGLVAVALAGLGVLIANGTIDLGAIGDRIQSGAKKVGDSLNNLDVSNIQTSLTGAFQGLDFSDVGPVMETHFNDILGTIAGVAGLVFGGPVGMAIGAARLVSIALDNDFLGISTFLKETGITDTVTTAFTDLKTQIDSIIQSVFSGDGGKQTIGDGIHSFMTDATGAGDGGMSAPLKLFVSDLQVGLDALKNLASDSWDKIKPGFDSLGNGLKGFADAFKDTDLEGIPRVVTGIGAAVGAIIGPLISLGSEIAGDLLTNLGNALPNIGSFISNLVSAISGVGKGDFGQTAMDIGQAAIDIGQAALDLVGINITVPSFEDAINGFKTGFEGIKAIVDTIGKTALAGIQDFAGGIKNTLIDLAQGFLDFRITLANLVGDSATVASLQGAKADWDKQRYVPVAATAGAMPGAANGANVVSGGVAVLHPSERVLNAQETKAYESGGSGGNTVIINGSYDVQTILYDLRRQGIDLMEMASRSKA